MVFEMEEKKKKPLRDRKVYARRYRFKVKRLIRKILGGKCFNCGSRKYLYIHHESYNKNRSKKSEVYFCDLKTLDLELLCGKCHRKKHPSWKTHKRDRRGRFK